MRLNNMDWFYSYVRIGRRKVQLIPLGCDFETALEELH
jgi:hypothetical protein